MRNLLQTHSLSWAESIRLALLAEGIEAVVLDPQSPGYIGFAGRVRVAVQDEDLLRAREILQQFESEKTQPTPSWRWQRQVFLLLGAAVFLLSFPSLWEVSRPVTILVALSELILITSLVVVVLRGYRKNRERPQVRP